VTAFFPVTGQKSGAISSPVKNQTYFRTPKSWGTVLFLEKSSFSREGTTKLPRNSDSHYFAQGNIPPGI